MTTFFQLGDGRDVVDCWAERVASVRTADVLVVRRATDVGDAARRGLSSRSVPSPAHDPTERATIMTPASPSVDRSRDPRWLLAARPFLTSSPGQVSRRQPPVPVPATRGASSPGR